MMLSSPNRMYSKTTEYIICPCRYVFCRSASSVDCRLSWIADCLGRVNIASDYLFVCTVIIINVFFFIYFHVFKNVHFCVLLFLWVLVHVYFLLSDWRNYSLSKLFCTIFCVHCICFLLFFQFVRYGFYSKMLIVYAENIM